MLMEWILFTVAFLYLARLFFATRCNHCHFLAKSHICLKSLKMQVGDKVANFLSINKLYGWKGAKVVNTATTSKLKKILRPWIYSLSIAVYCSSWVFFGAIEQAISQPWSFISFFLAPVIVFSCGWRFIAQMILIAKREHITSIADFIASRYGQSKGLAQILTLIALLGTLPYLAIQFRSITIGLEVLAPDLVHEHFLGQNNVALVIGIIFAVITLLFNSQYINATKPYKGLIAATAFEAVIKFIAILAVGLFSLALLFNAPIHLSSPNEMIWSESFHWYSFLLHTLLAMAAMICLPRQFYVLVVQNTRIKDLHTARRFFPVYSVAMGLLIIPIAYAGFVFFPTLSSTNYAIALPLLNANFSLALLAFIGAISGAVGMVMVSTITLSIMLSNDLILPILLRKACPVDGDFSQFSRLLFTIRRGLILFILFLAWCVYFFTLKTVTLNELASFSFAVIAQFLPALIGGIYWKKAHKIGVYCGLIAGICVWLTAFLIQTKWSYFIERYALFTDLLIAPDIAFFANLSFVDWSITLSIMLNIICFVFVSLFFHMMKKITQSSVNDIDNSLLNNEVNSRYQFCVTVAQLEMLGAKFVGKEQMHRSFQTFSTYRLGRALLPKELASAALIRHTERVLSGVFGASSAKLVLRSALQGRNMRLKDIATIVDEASDLFDFSRGLLQGAIEHISQGISVVDKQLKLVAWNQRYIDLFKFPPELIQVGQPIAEVIRYNAERGLCGLGSVDELVKKRVNFLHKGSPHTSSRAYPDGRVIEVQGNPMPGGGFVMSFTDISAFRNVEGALKQANETLEARVIERTQALEALNRRLIYATEKAEQASQSKSRLLAVVSHDLMQPLNAARLFASSLAIRAHDSETQKISSHIESALGAAEDLIGDLLDISRLESGKMTAKLEWIELNDVFSTLAAEFGMIANKQGIDFRVQSTRLKIHSDKRLLRRVLQNFLTNAFRYNPHGRVLLGARRVGQQCRIEVWDNGPGIEIERQQDIFNDFTRIENKNGELGLGLGLAIARGISRILEQPLNLRSWPEHGSVFSILANCVTTSSKENKSCQTYPQLEIESRFEPLFGICVLCVDNEPDILLAMESLLSRWGCQVLLGEDLEQVEALIQQGYKPDVILSDYHLAHFLTGLDVLQRCQQWLADDAFVGVIITADTSVQTQQKICDNNFTYLAKPVKPIKLRAILNKAVDMQIDSQY